MQDVGGDSLASLGGGMGWLRDELENTPWAPSTPIRRAASPSGLSDSPDTATLNAVFRAEGVDALIVPVGLAQPLCEPGSPVRKKQKDRHSPITAAQRWAGIPTETKDAILTFNEHMRPAIDEEIVRRGLRWWRKQAIYAARNAWNLSGQGDHGVDVSRMECKGYNDMTNVVGLEPRHRNRGVSNNRNADSQEALGLLPGKEPMTTAPSAGMVQRVVAAAVAEAEAKQRMYGYGGGRTTKAELVRATVAAAVVVREERCTDASAAVQERKLCGCVSRHFKALQEFAMQRPALGRAIVFKGMNRAVRHDIHKMAGQMKATFGLVSESSTDKSELRVVVDGSAEQWVSTMLDEWIRTVEMDAVLRKAEEEASFEEALCAAENERERCDAERAAKAERDRRAQRIVIDVEEEDERETQRMLHDIGLCEKGCCYVCRDTAENAADPPRMRVADAV